MKIAKYFTGFTTGSFAGRDDGYPETRRVTYDLTKKADQVKFVKEFGTQRDEKFVKYEETELALASVRVIRANLQHEIEAEHQHIERAEKMAKYEQLKKELGL